MEFNMMAGYGDYNWSLILWLFIGIMLFIIIAGIAVRKVNKNKEGHHPKGKLQRDVVKERRTRSGLSGEDYKKQKKDVAN
ncbi:MAG: hypothetical protein ACOC0R_05775 [Mariniphaga sp.]